MVIAFHAVSRVMVFCVLGLGSALLGCHHERAREPEPPCSHLDVEPGECTGSIEVTDVPDPLMVLVRFDYRWAGEDAATTEPARWAWDVPREQLDELRATALPRVPCERSFPIGPGVRAGCKAVLLQPNAVKDPQVPIEARDRICPRTLSTPLNPQIADLDPFAIAATFVAEHGNWHRALVNPHAAESEVQGLYTSGEQQVRITVRDMIHECTGEDAPNTMLETESKVGELALSRRMMSATSAVMIRVAYGRGPRHLVMWIAGRCRVTVIALTNAFVDKGHAFPVGLPDEDFAAAGEVVDVAALEPLCAARAHR